MPLTPLNCPISPPTLSVNCYIAEGKRLNVSTAPFILPSTSTFLTKSIWNDTTGRKERGNTFSFFFSFAFSYNPFFLYLPLFLRDQLVLFCIADTPHDTLKWIVCFWHREIDQQCKRTLKWDWIPVLRNSVLLRHKCCSDLKRNLEVFLTVHLSIILVIDQINEQILVVSQPVHQTATYTLWRY